MLRPPWTCVCVCVCASVYLTQPLLFNSLCTTATKKLNLEDYSLCLLFTDCHGKVIREALQAHFFAFFTSCHQWAKHFPRAGNGILVATNGKSRPALQSVLPDWDSGCIQAAGLFTKRQNDTHLCQVWKFASLSCRLLLQSILYTEACEK